MTEQQQINRTLQELQQCQMLRHDTVCWAAAWLLDRAVVVLEPTWGDSGLACSASVFGKGSMQLSCTQQLKASEAIVLVVNSGHYSVQLLEDDLHVQLLPGTDGYIQQLHFGQGSIWRATGVFAADCGVDDTSCHNVNLNISSSSITDNSISSSSNKSNINSSRSSRSSSCSSSASSGRQHACFTPVARSADGSRLTPLTLADFVPPGLLDSRTVISSYISAADSGNTCKASSSSSVGDSTCSNTGNSTCSHASNGIGSKMCSSIGMKSSDSKAVVIGSRAPAGSSWNIGSSHSNWSGSNTATGSSVTGRTIIGSSSSSSSSSSCNSRQCPANQFEVLTWPEAQPQACAVSSMAGSSVVGSPSRSARQQQQQSSQQQRQRLYNHKAQTVKRKGQRHCHISAASFTDPWLLPASKPARGCLLRFFEAQRTGAHASGTITQCLSSTNNVTLFLCGMSYTAPAVHASQKACVVDSSSSQQLTAQGQPALSCRAALPFCLHII